MPAGGRPPPFRLGPAVDRRVGDLRPTARDGVRETLTSGHPLLPPGPGDSVGSLARQRKAAIMSEADLVLQSARASYADYDWQAAFEGFTTAAASAALLPADLDALADSAYWSCHPTEALEAGQRAYAAYLEEGQFGEAASAALRAALLLFVRGDAVVGSGWADRARRLLSDLPECSAHATLAWGDAQLLLHLKSHDEALEKAREVVAIAGRVGDRDLVALGLAMQGLVRVRTGDVSDGLALIGEALAGAIAEARASRRRPEIMCEMVTSCSTTTTTSAPPSGWTRRNEADATSLRFPVVAAPTARLCSDIGQLARSPGAGNAGARNSPVSRCSTKGWLLPRSGSSTGARAN